jgi:CheY-like chemotaxis protein
VPISQCTRSCAGWKSAASSPAWCMEMVPSDNDESGYMRSLPVSVCPPQIQESPRLAIGTFPFLLTSTPAGRRIRRSSPQARQVGQCGMYQPPPLRGRPVFDDKKVLLIDPHQRARDVRARVLHSHGIEVQTAENLCRARVLWRPHAYDLILLDARGHLPGEALDFYLEIKHASPHQRVVFLVGPPTYLSLTWPTEVMGEEEEPQQWAETVRRLVTAA